MPASGSGSGSLGDCRSTPLERRPEGETNVPLGGRPDGQHFVRAERSVLCGDAEVFGETTQEFGIHRAVAEQHLLRHDGAEPAVVTSQ